MRARRDLLRRAVAAPAALAVSTGMQYRRRRYTRGVQSPKLREGGLMVRAVARYWWVVALRGLAALAFGLLALFSPAMTLAVLVLFFGAYALADGVLAIWTALRGETEHRLPMALNGVVGVLAGLAAFVWPGMTAIVLLYIIAFWAIVTGVLQVLAAVRLRRVISNEWAMALSGALSILFGVVLVASPGAGALAVVLVIGAYAVLFGLMLLMLSWRLRSHHQAVAISGEASRTATS